MASCASIQDLEPSYHERKATHTKGDWRNEIILLAPEDAKELSDGFGEGAAGTERVVAIDGSLVAAVCGVIVNARSPS